MLDSAQVFYFISPTSNLLLYSNVESIIKEKITIFKSENLEGSFLISASVAFRINRKIIQSRRDD